MSKIERRRKIKDIIFDRRQIDVKTIGKLLNVSDATIRNDFEELEKEGYLRRYHGGATLLSGDEERINDPHFGNIVKYDRNKEEIGMIASNLISEKDWIFLGPGTTSYFIARALLSRNNLKIFTNNLLVSNILSNNSTIQIHFLGGKIDNLGLYSIPNDLTKDLNNIYINKSFFSVDGVDIDAGYTLSDLNVLDIIKAISARCQETIFALDSSKFGQRTFMKVGDLDFAQSVIINDGVSATFRQYYSEHNICVHTPNDLKILTIK